MITYEIIKHLGTLSSCSSAEYEIGEKEVNIVAWNDRPSKFDIRSWDKNHQKMNRGISLTKEEAKKLCDILNDYFNNEEE